MIKPFVLALVAVCLLLAGCARAGSTTTALQPAPTLAPNPTAVRTVAPLPVTQPKVQATATSAPAASPTATLVPTVPADPAEEAVAACGEGALPSTASATAVGRQATVYIKRVYGSYRPDVRGQPTFLNDAPFPRHSFTAIIWGNSRAAFAPPPEDYPALCITGLVTVFDGKPQIQVTVPAQLRPPAQ